MQLLRDELFRVGLVYSDPLLQSSLDQGADTGLSYKQLRTCPERHGRVVTALTMLVAGLRPDLVIGISEDSSRYARDVARARGVHCLPLVESETGEPYFKGLGQTLVPFYGRIALVGSVVSDRLDVLGVLKLPGVGERAVGLVSIWDQGQEGDRAVLPEYLEQRAVVQECLPHRINNEGSAARVPTA